MENNPSFEVVESDEKTVVFKRAIKNRTKNKKELQRISASLPTATIRFFTQEQYTKLKEIEKKLIQEIENRKDRSSLKTWLITLLTK